MVAERIAPIIATSDIAALDRAFEGLRRSHAAAPYPSREARLDRLDRLERTLRKHDAAIRESISADFGNRAHEETLLFEQFVGIEGIRHARSHLRRWMRTERRAVAWWSLPGRAQIRYQPLGVIGVIVPWNYPLYLAVGPLTGALAAGNRVLIKMSEFTPRFGELFARVIAEAFAADEVAVVNGGVDVARHFSTLPFDHLFFTGSTRVGREVMKAASANLTPVTLELGGKSPVIVTDDFSLEEAARRIVYGKLANAGQTCVAPDYALVPTGKVDRFIESCRQATATFYPSLTDNPQYTSNQQLNWLWQALRRNDGVLQDLDLALAVTSDGVGNALTQNGVAFLTGRSYVLSGGPQDSLQQLRTVSLVLLRRSLHPAPVLVGSFQNFLRQLRVVFPSLLRLSLYSVPAPVHVLNAEHLCVLVLLDLLVPPAPALAGGLWSTPWSQHAVSLLPRLCPIISYCYQTHDAPGICH